MKRMQTFFAAGVLLTGVQSHALDEVITDAKSVEELADNYTHRDADNRPFRGLSTKRLRGAINQQSLQLLQLQAELDAASDRADALLFEVVGGDTGNAMVELGKAKAEQKRLRGLIRETQSNLLSLTFEFHQAID